MLLCLAFLSISICSCLFTSTFCMYNVHVCIYTRVYTHYDSCIYRIQVYMYIHSTFISKYTNRSGESKAHTCTFIYFFPCKLKVKRIAIQEDSALLDSTPDCLLVDHTLSSIHSGLNLLCYEQIPFLPRRKLEFVDYQQQKSSRPFGEGAFMHCVYVHFHPVLIADFFNLCTLTFVYTLKLFMD